MFQLNPALNIQRLNELAVSQPALLTELGILKPEPTADDLIKFPPPVTGFTLRKIMTGQASIFENGSLRLEFWTTPQFDFNVKEWARSVVLDDQGKAEVDGITVSVVDGVCTLQHGTDRLQLPPFAKTYANDRLMAKSVLGNARFSNRPGRQKWVTGPMVWL